MYMKEQMTMEAGRLEYVLDSILLFRAQGNELRQQQHRHYLESISRMVALIDLPVSIASLKRRKGSTHYFQTHKAEECRDVNGKENILAAGGTEVLGAQLKSCKASSRKTRRRKPLVDSQAINQSRQLDTSACTRIADRGEQEEALGFGQRGNEELLQSTEGNKNTSMAAGGNDELVHSIEGNKKKPISVRGDEELVHSVEGIKSMSISISPLSTSSAGEAEASVPSLRKPSGVPESNAVSIEGGEPAQVETEVPDLVAPVLTRARARTLQNAGGNVTIARGEPPLKKRRARRAKSNSICSSPAKKDETAGRVHIIVAQTPLEQEEGKRPPSKRSVAVKRNTRGSSPSPSQTNGNVGKDAFGEEQAVKVVKRNTRGNSHSPPQAGGNVAGKEDDFSEEQDMNPNSICRLKEETAGKMQTIVVQIPLEQQERERPPSMRSVAVKRSTRSNSRSPPQADGNVGKKDEFGEEQGISPNSICRSPAEKDETAGKMQTTVAETPVELRKRERPPSIRSVAVKRSTRSKSRSPSQADGNVAEKDASGEEQEMKVVKVKNMIPDPSRTAEEDENVGKGRPSKKSRTSLGRSTRLNSSSPTEIDAFELAMRGLEDAEVNEHCLGKVHPSVEEALNSRGGSVTKRSRKRIANSRSVFAALGETDRNVLQFETVMNQNESLRCTEADQHVTKLISSTESGVPACSLLTHAAQNGNASELRLLHSSAETIYVDVADPESVEAVRVDLGDVHNGTDLPSGCLPSAEDPKGELSTIKPLLEDGADTGSKLISVLSSPPLQEEFVERDADIIHAELKNEEDRSSISDVPPEEEVEEEKRPLREEGHRRKFSNSLAETVKDNPDGTPRIVANSVGVQSSAVELEIKETTMDAIGAGNASVVGKASKRIKERKDGMQLLSFGDSLEVSISPHGRDCDIADQGEFHNSPEAAVELPESVGVSEGKSSPGQVQVTYKSPHITYRTPVRRAKLLQSITTPEVHREELIDEETAAPGSLQLKTNERNHFLKTPAVGHIQGGLISGTISDVAGQVDERGGEWKLIIPPDLDDVNSSVAQECRKETAGGFENGQTTNARVLSSVEKWDRDRLLEVGKNKPLVAVLSSFERATPAASVNDQHRVDEVGVQRYTDLGCDLHEESKPSDGKRLVDHLPEREGCERTQVSYVKEVGTFVTSSLEQASESSTALGRYHSEGIAPIDFAPSLINAQHSSELRLSRLMSRKHAELSWTIADAAREDGTYKSGNMKPRLVHDAQRDWSGACSEVNEKGKPQLMTSKLELCVDSANKPMLPFPIDESSISFQNQKTTDHLLELWKKGSSQRSDLILAQEGPGSSEPPVVSTYKLDVIDEVYRSVVVRECGAKGGVSALTLPVANWRSGSFCSTVGVSAQCSKPRVVMETAFPLNNGTEIVREVTEFDSSEDRLKPDQDENTIKPSSSLLIQDEDQDQNLDTQDADSALENSGMVECSHETGVVECPQDIDQDIDEDCQVSSERDCTVNEQLLSHEELNRSKPIPLSRGEEDSAISNLPLHRPEVDAAVPVPDASCNLVRSVDSLQQQVVSSNVGNAPKPSSNLVASMKSFVPVVQHQPPSFLPDGKRFVKVKALIAAEAARRAEEKGDVKDRLRKNKKRGTPEENASCGMEKEEAAGQTSIIIPLKESVEASSKLDGESSCGSILSPRKKVLLRDRSNSRNLFSPEAKSKQATNLEIEKKVKKNQAELKRMEEQRKRKLLAMRENKEQVVKENRQRQELLKHKKDQKRLGAPELEDKGQRHQAPEEAERERKPMEEKVQSKQFTPGPRENECRQGEELKLKGDRKGVTQAQLQKRREAIEEKENDTMEGLSLVRPTLEGQGQKGRAGQTPGKIRSNLLGPGTLPLRLAGRVPIVSKDKRTPITVATAIQQKGRQPSSSSSSSRLLTSNAEPAKLPSLNGEAARWPSLNAEFAEGVPHNSIHTFSLDNKPTNVRQGGSGETVLCIATPCSGAVEKEEDMGPTSYEMSPYKESSDEEDEPRNRVSKHIPVWVRKENLNPHVLKQLTIDPDEIFSGSKTCSLKEIFGTTGSKKIQDFGKRSGSGDWVKDRVSWKEELQYKIAMSYETK